MRLTFGAGPRSGQAIEVVGTMLVGRDEDCDLELADEKVSRRHARLTAQPDGTVLVEDLGSTNGTFVDGARIGGPATLRGGEELRIGSSVARAAGERAAAATVVRAPETVVAASALPPAAAPTAAGQGRPWWRSRWALVGVVAGLVAVGGIVGGVLAASGGGEDAGQGAAAGQTEPLETVAGTGPAVTGVPAETTQTTPADPEWEALLVQIPESHREACTEFIPEGEGEVAELLTPQMVVGAYCELPDGLQAWYLQMDSRAAMQDAYWAYAVADDRRNYGSCESDPRAEGPYSIGDTTAGRLLCLEVPESGSTIWWTHNPTAILSTAGAPDRDQLLAWWRDEAGPVG